MSGSPTKLQRWLDVIAYLVGRRLPVSRDELMRNVPAYAKRWASTDAKDQEAVRRAFERDKDELRKQGIPIRTLKYSTPHESDSLEGYIIDRRDFYLPYLRLVNQLSGTVPYRERARPATVEITETEAPLALDALRRITGVPGFPFAREARSAFRKLAFDLDPNAFADDAPVLFVDRPGEAEQAERLRRITDALLARKRIAFDYYGIYRDEKTRRDVAAYGLLFQHGHWYVIGYDAARGGMRVFRVARMGDVSQNMKAPNTPDYTIPADFRLADWTDRQAWELGEGDEPPVKAQVLFRFPLSLWAERNGYGMPVTREPDGGIVREFDVHQVGPFLRWLLGFEGEADVLEPLELRDALRNMAHAVAAAHGGAIRGDAS
jgi:predicted DNA-binding transcriptional regulator YafY